MEKNVVDKIYSDFTQLIDFLECNEEISMKNEADNNFKKVLVLTIASYFETKITSLLIDFVGRKTNLNGQIISLVRNKISGREYHKLFNWEHKNANSFFQLFGEDFQSSVEQDVEKDGALNESICAFLRIGNDRNKMVHENFGVFMIDETAKEVYELYEKANCFMSYLSKKLD